MAKRVFISHTSEFTKYPDSRSFIDAAKSAVNRAGHVPCDMSYFTARDQQPAVYCQQRVRECDIYVGVIGLRYGSPVRDRPEISHTELEFETAGENEHVRRLVFLLDDNTLLPGWFTQDVDYGRRQVNFRQRLQNNADLTTAPFGDPSTLEMLIYQALAEQQASSDVKSDVTRVDWPSGKSPYPGLEWFDAEYAPVFFGRENDVEAVLEKIAKPGGRVLLISGDSGLGKSSLVAAGLWQAIMQDGHFPGSAQWTWLRIQPSDGDTPWQALAAGFKQHFPKIKATAMELARQWAEEKTTIGSSLREHTTFEQETFLFVDQLEELFTSGFAKIDIQRFLSHLVDAGQEADNRLRIVATFRSEFTGTLQESEAFRERVLNAGATHYVGGVSPRALPDMIERPAQVTGYEFEDGLVEAILNEVGQERGVLPLVAYALKQLWERRSGKVLTRAAYDQLGGVVGAIGTKADSVLCALASSESEPDVQESSHAIESGEPAAPVEPSEIPPLPSSMQASFDRVFAELVHLHRDRPPTRKRAPLSVFADEPDARAMIQALVSPDCRVLVTSGETGEGDEINASHVEVAHEQLFLRWPRLDAWIRESGEAIRDIEFAEEGAAQWEKAGKPVHGAECEQSAIHTAGAGAVWKISVAPAGHNAGASGISGAAAGASGPLARRAF